MTDKEAAKRIQEASIGINVAIGHLADIKAALFGLRVSNEMILVAHKDMLVRSGKKKEEVEAALSRTREQIIKLVAAEMKYDIPPSDEGGSLPGSAKNPLPN